MSHARVRVLTAMPIVLVAYRKPWLPCSVPPAPSVEERSTPIAAPVGSMSCPPIAICSTSASLSARVSSAVEARVDSVESKPSTARMQTRKSCAKLCPIPSR